tara:strand:- start:86 stop:547 length:462 start_codon:yes stop_codon:yes gene_type:complete
MSIFKKNLIVFLALIIASCTLNKVDNVHGVSNLKNKISLIKNNKSNKNDIIQIFGPMPVIDKKDNRWAYFEVRETKTKYGKKNIYVNDYIEIYFDRYGIVKEYKFFNLNNMNDIKFAKEKTRTLGVKDTFTKNLLSSTRQRMENARKKYQKKN